jgi:hypothetical protein
MLTNRAMRRIIESMGEKLTKGRRHLHKKKPLEFCSSPNIVGMIRSRTIRLAGHVVLMEGN